MQLSRHYSLLGSSFTVPEIYSSLRSIPSHPSFDLSLQCLWRSSIARKRLARLRENKQGELEYLSLRLECAAGVRATKVIAKYFRSFLKSCEEKLIYYDYKARSPLGGSFSSLSIHLASGEFHSPLRSFITEACNEVSWHMLSQKLQSRGVQACKSIIKAPISSYLVITRCASSLRHGLHAISSSHHVMSKHAIHS